MDTSLRHPDAHHRASNLAGDHSRVLTDTVDEAGVPAALKIVAEHEETDFRGHPAFMCDFAVGIEHGDA